MSGIWINVTTLMAWKSTAVGIVRVEAEVAKVAGLASGVNFCQFQGPSGFTRVESSEVLDKLAHLQSHREDTRPKTPDRHWLLKFPYAQHLIKMWVSTIRRVWARLARRSSALSPAPTAYPVFFDSRDVLVTLGLDWFDRTLEAIEYYKRTRGIKVVFLCYDVIPLTHPYFFAPIYVKLFAQYIESLCRIADEALCISRFTEAEFRRCGSERGLLCPETSVITLGCEVRAGNIVTEVIASNPSPFLLYVSSLERRKNHEVLYRAYVRLIDAGYKDLPHLYLVGKSSGEETVFERDSRRDPRVAHLIRFLPNVGDQELVSLYHECLFTVYPSLCEGWGLPVSESLALGKFCLCANTSSLPEVAGNLVEYLDPWDAQSWADRIRHYLDSPVSLLSANSRIRAEYSPPSWLETGQSVLAAASRYLKESVT